MKPKEILELAFIIITGIIILLAAVLTDKSYEERLKNIPEPQLWEIEQSKMIM